MPCPKPVSRFYLVSLATVITFLGATVLANTATAAMHAQAQDSDTPSACQHHSNEGGHEGHKLDDKSCSHHKGGHHGHHGKGTHGKYRAGRHGGERGGADMQAMRDRMAELGLTDTQKQEFAALMQIYRPRFEALRKRGQEDRQALLNMLPDAEDYDALVSRVSKEVANSAAEVIVLLGELQATAYALLSDEQQKAYVELKEKAKRMRLEMQAKGKERMDAMRERRDKSHPAN